MSKPPFANDPAIADAFWNAPIGLFETDANGMCRRVNQRWADLTGLDWKAALGEGWIAAIHPDDRFRVFIDWEKATSSADDFLLAFRYQKPDGTVVPIECRATKLVDETGNITGYVGTVNKTVVEDTVPYPVQAASLGHALFQNAPVGIQLFNHRGTSILVNERQRAHLGLATVETGVGVFNLLTDPFSRETSLAEGFLRAREGEVVHLPTELVDYSRGSHWGLTPESRWVERTMFPVALDNGEHAVALIVRDVTGRMRSVEALRGAETRFRQVFEAAGDGIALVDTTYSGVIANPAFESIVGALPGGLEGFHMLELFDSDEDMDLVGTDLATTNSSRRNIVARRLDGTTFHAATHFVNLFDDAGNLSGVLVVARDITERVESRLAIEASEQKLRDVIDGLSTFVYVFEESDDGKLRCNLANAALLRRLGVSYETVMGSTPRQILGDDWGGSLLRQVREAAETGRIVEEERTRSLPRGTRVFQTRAIPSVNSLNGRVMVICETRDVTAQHENRRLAEDHARIVSLSTLAAGVAHDFNNILQSILLGTELATDAAPANWVGLEILADVRVSTLRAAELATKMLAFSGQAPLRPQNITLEMLSAGLSVELAGVIPEGVNIVTDFLDGEATISGDDGQLVRALSSIIVNAAEAASGSGDVHVTFGTEAPGPLDMARAYPPGSLTARQYACIQVRDSGEGMDAGTLARIFEPFFSTKFAGRGLGLSAALGVIRGHGGGIIVDSEVGSGTNMRIMLPLADDQVDEEAA